jgi:hypothetical protein
MSHKSNGGGEKSSQLKRLSMTITNLVNGGGSLDDGSDSAGKYPMGPIIRLWTQKNPRIFFGTFCTENKCGMTRRTLCVRYFSTFCVSNGHMVTV